MNSLSLSLSLSPPPLSLLLTVSLSLLVSVSLSLFLLCLYLSFQLPPSPSPIPILSLSVGLSDVSDLSSPYKHYLPTSLTGYVITTPSIVYDPCPDFLVWHRISGSSSGISGAFFFFFFSCPPAPPPHLGSGFLSQIRIWVKRKLGPLFLEES